MSIGEAVRLEAEVTGWESYHKTPEELDTIEATTVQTAIELTGVQEGVVALALRGTSELADFGRTYESLTFDGYDFHAAMKSYEDHSIFLYTIDLDEGRIAHTKRIVEPKTIEEMAETGITGIEMIDDRLRSDVDAEKCDIQTILDYHQLSDVGYSMNIATNLATGRVATSMEKPYSLMSYKAVFEMTRRLDKTHLFAYLNNLAVRSLAKLGLDYDLMAGQEFHLPLPLSTEEYDGDYKAVCIPDNDQNIAAFTKFNPAKPLTKLIADRDVPLAFLV